MAQVKKTKISLLIYAVVATVQGSSHLTEEILEYETVRAYRVTSWLTAFCYYPEEYGMEHSPAHPLMSALNGKGHGFSLH